MTFETAFQSALRTQGAILSDDEIKRAEFVARSVAVAMLEEAVTVIPGGGWCDPQKIADDIRAIIQQVQGPKT